MLETVGGESVRQVHYLCLHSAYEDVSLRGEPIFTQSLLKASNIADIKCADYVFYSESSLIVGNVLSLPRLSRIEGDDARFRDLLYNNHKTPPDRLRRYFSKDLGIPEGLDEESITRILTDKLNEIDEGWNEFMAGTWTPFPESNERRKNVLLPMQSSGSCHMLLCADFLLNAKYASVQWPAR